MEMINLLPDNDKKQIRAGRTNVLLVRYNLLVVLSIIFLCLALGFAYYYLSSARQIAEDSVRDNVDQEGSYASVKAEADKFRSELSTAKTILDGQTSYAKAALNIAKLLPNGTALNSLKLDEKSFTAPLVLTVNINDEQAAVDLLNNFKSSPLFSNATKGKISVGTGAYPYTMELTVTMSKAAGQ
jgi:hypothetical protein